MIKRVALLTLLFLSLLQSAGCKSEPIVHPTTNVVAGITDNPRTHPSEKGNTIVIARLASHREYAQEPTKNPSWRRHWYLTKFDVLRVELGTWAEQEVSLVTDHVWPTPESGIMLSMGPDRRVPPAFPAAIWALHLDTAAKPARLVGFEERSLVPPHDKPPVSLDYEPVDPKTPYMRKVASPDKIFPPAEAFLAAMGKVSGKDFDCRRTEQTQTAYVVQTVAKPDKDGHQSVWTLAVDKITGKVTLLWAVP